MNKNEKSLWRTFLEYGKLHKVITVLIALFLLLMILLSVFNTKETISVLTKSLTTLTSAFLGAFFAFRFQNKREEKNKIKENAEAANRALFTLSRFNNELSIIKKQVIDPVRDREDVYLALKPTLILNYDDYKFNVDSLSFLLESEQPNILGELLLEESRFHQTINVLQSRTELHKNIIQPILEKATDGITKPITIEEAEKAIGFRYFQELKLSTDTLIEWVDIHIKTTEDLMTKFGELLKSMYPGHPFIYIVPDDNKPDNNL